ncbi:MAG TPA: SagB/ThcOx family dehydrogenase, partial [Phototrophicaceae bacterium]|nr:SagB/ThcOx family dehydrogenase [Phototrophicaceae bacterium]
IDWSNRPNPFKIYTELPTIPLPSDLSIPSLNANLAINKSYPQSNQSKTLDNIFDSTTTTNTNTNANLVSKDSSITKTEALTSKDLAEILFYSAGITREIRYYSGILYMRAASATGALYPIEIYIVCKDISPDLKAGVYHFNPAEFSLKNIRRGDYSHTLASIAGNNKHLSKSPLTIIITSYAWRNAWKYQDRSYRHWFWDSGVIVANLLAIAASKSLKAKLTMGFIDDEVNRLLSLEKGKEASIAMVAIDTESIHNFDSGINNAEKEKFSDSTPPKSISLSREETQYPAIWKAYDCSKLFDENEVKKWVNAGLSQSGNFFSHREESAPQKKQTLKRQDLPKGHQHSNVLTIGETILRRGSTRKFARSPISFHTLSSILYNSTRGISIDFKKDTESLVEIYLIANNVEGLDNGAYFYNRNYDALDLLNAKVSRNLSGYLCLNQPLFSDASVVLFMMSNLDKILKILGNRGYRAAQFEAGIIAGKIYLSSYAHRIGASGSTFYDDAVTEFFSPHSKDKDTMIAVGIGVPSYKARAGKILPVRFTKEQLVRNHSV